MTRQKPLISVITPSYNATALFLGDMPAAWLSSTINGSISSAAFISSLLVSSSYKNRCLSTLESALTVSSSSALIFYGEAKYNNAKQVPLLLKNEAFLKDIFPDMPEEDLAQLKDDLAIEIRTDSLFNLSYTGPDKQETLDTLGKIKDAYMHIGIFNFS